ncbi:MAG: PKD domain-containing protein [Chitinophagaceae bacterium]|nr:PKD domain-containing protein [Chitinophagaceae bacterium]
MKKIFTLLTVCVITSQIYAQQLVFDLMERTDISIREAETIANRYFDSAGTGRGTGYKQFQRWLYERKFHTDENGYYIPPQTDWNNYLQSRSSLQPGIIAAANWTELGPLGWNRTSSWNPGTGRISAMAIHPANESIIYAGSPGGGLWKTVNAGASWQPLTDNNSLWMSVFSITIDPGNQNIVYAGTSTGLLLKSVDAGINWSPTGAGPTGTIRKILIHPTSGNIVFACASNGIFRSTNSGTSWTQVHSVSKEDIEFKPNDVNILIASGNDVVRSVDNGVTWTTLGAAQGITNSGRTLVAVSAANPNTVYAVQASGSLFGRMYKSTDAGLTFVTTVVGNPASGTNYFGYEASGTGTSGQAGYDMGMDVSPTNANDVYIAGIICWRSVNGATSFTPLTEWFLPNSTGYNHADVHGLQWINSTIYSISDGGIYKSIDMGDNWTDLSPGLGIRQFYRIANSQTNANVITGGAQDNGSVARQVSGTWVDWLGADGMEGLVSPTDHLKLWGTSQNGSIYRSTNGGNSYTGLPRPSPGQWVTPLFMHPTNETILYGGWTGVYKSTNSGTSWTLISGATITTTLADLAVAPSNPNYIYASNGNTLYVTTDDGANWVTRTAPSTINDIAVDPTNPSKIWIACNSTTNRVMVSTDAGATFTNISGNLPAIIARTVVVDNQTPRGIYVGMNIGVYYKDEASPNWVTYSDNLPLVAVNELEIQFASGKIRVATYGRGVWESPVVSTCAASVPVADFTANAVNICVGQTVAFTNNSTDCQSTYAWTFAGGTPATSTATNPTVTYNTQGNYTVSLTVTNPGGSNTKTVNGYITVNTNLTHSISISSPNTNICANQTATFNLSSSNGGISPTISWFKNGISIPGTNGLTTVTLSNLNNNDIITCSELTSAACATPAIVISNQLTVTVSPNLTHTASISTPKTSLCSGESATFTLTNTNPGSSPVISWFRNGVSIPGTSGSGAITISTPVNGDIITCSETSNANCVAPVTITTNSISLIVTPKPAKPTITQNIGDLLSSSTGGNQWFLNSVALNNATGSTIHPVKNGIYQVQVTVNGCISLLSDPFNLIIEGVNRLYPVPSGGQVTFDFYAPDGVSKYQLVLTSSTGQLIHQENGAIQPGLNRLTYNWDRLAAGIYQLQMQVGALQYKKRLLIQ